MIPIMVLAVVSVGAALFAGYLFGVRKGRDARAGLHLELERGEGALRSAELKAQQLLQERDALRTELDERVKMLQRTVTAQDESAAALRAEVMHSIQPLIVASSASTKLGQELQRIVSTLDARDRDSASLEKQVEDLLEPMLSKERLGQALGNVVTDADRRGLPKLLDAIARQAGLSTVMLSDGVGLPLASSDSSDDPEALAAISSLLVSLADKIGALGISPPLAAVLKDESNRTILHRLFTIEAERFVLTAVSQGPYLPPDGLDPALNKICQLLSVRG